MSEYSRQCRKRRGVKTISGGYLGRRIKDTINFREVNNVLFLPILQHLIP